MDATKVNFDQPDEQRSPDKTQVDVVRTPTGSVARFTLQPGWTWSECVKSVVGGESCQVTHLGYVVSGSILITTDSGEEMEYSGGDVYSLTPGHLAKVTSDEPFVGIEFEPSATEEYAAT
jgi:hypothetical protein